MKLNHSISKLSIIALTVLVTLAIITGCTQPAPTSAPKTTAAPTTTSAPKTTVAPTTTAAPATPTAKPATTPAPAAKTWDLKFPVVYPSATAPQVSMAFIPFTQELEKRTGGRVKAALHYGSSLGKPDDHYDMVKTGLADITWYVLSYGKGRFPMSGIAELPFAVPNSTVGSQAMLDLYKSGLLDKEFADVKVLGMTSTSAYQLFLAKKTVKVLDDFKGLKIREPGGLMTQALKLWGAVPIALPGTEQYGGFEKGILDGSQLTYASAPGFKLEEVTKNITEASFTASSHVIAINRNVWNGMPADIQKIIEELSVKMMQDVAKAYDDTDLKTKQSFIAKGIQIYELPTAERVRWINATKSIWDGWVTEAGKSGAPSADVFKKFVSGLKSRGVELPF